MLQLVNRDRLGAGLRPVGWDALAARVAQQHAAEQVRRGYFSHWNLTGHGPDHRYSQAGGTHAVRENIHGRSCYGPGVLPPLDWEEIVETAQEGLMNSPGHRLTILDPDATHLGVGAAHDPATGEVRVVQLFVARYVTVLSCPREASWAREYQVAGRLHPGVSDPIINLAREPFPRPMTVAGLNATSVYQSAADTYQALPVAVDGSGAFRAPVRFDRLEGLHHIRLWVTFQGRHVLASDLVAEVR